MFFIITLLANILLSYRENENLVGGRNQKSEKRSDRRPKAKLTEQFWGVPGACLYMPQVWEPRTDLGTLVSHRVPTFLIGKSLCAPKRSGFFDL